MGGVVPAKGRNEMKIRKAALVTNEGTAMPETCLCSQHMVEPHLTASFHEATKARDWNGQEALSDVTENENCSCIVCGFNH